MSMRLGRPAGRIFIDRVSEPRVAELPPPLVAPPALGTRAHRVGRPPRAAKAAARGPRLALQGVALTAEGPVGVMDGGGVGAAIEGRSGPGEPPLGLAPALLVPAAALFEQVGTRVAAATGRVSVPRHGFSLRALTTPD